MRKKSSLKNNSCSILANNKNIYLKLPCSVKNLSYKNFSDIFIANSAPLSSFSFSRWSLSRLSLAVLMLLPCLSNAQVLDNESITWTGANGVSWDQTAKNWNTRASEQFLPGDKVTFTLTGAGDVYIDSSGVIVSDMIVQGGSYQFRGGAITTTGTVQGGQLSSPNEKLVINGGSVDLTQISGSNQFAGGVSIGSGRLIIANEGQLGTNLANLNFTSIASSSAFGVLSITQDTVFNAASGQNDQRLNVNTNAAGIDIAASKTMTIKNNDGNTNSLNGSAIYVATGGVFTQTGEGSLAFESNQTRLTSATNNTYGGAIFNTGTTTLGNNALFTDNAAYVYGGAIFNGRIFSIGTGANFSGNQVMNKHGGAIYNSREFFIDNGATFSNNKTNSQGHGGAIYNTSLNGKFILGNTARFNNNIADSDGGAIYNGTNGTMSIGFSAMFEENQANRFGGAIANYNSTVSVDGNASFIDNIAQDIYGGAIYNNAGILNIDTGLANHITIFSGNKAGGVANSITMRSDTQGNSYLNISGSGVLDMRDAMSGVSADVSASFNMVEKNGTGQWKLGGLSDFSTTIPVGGNNYWSINSGELYLYRVNEVSNANNGWVETGRVKLSGAGSSFNLDTGAKLTAAGSGHSIATGGTIVLANNATLGFDLFYHDANKSTAMLTLRGDNGVSVGNALNVDLLSLNNVLGKYVLATSTSGTDFSSAVNAGTVTYKGSPIEQTRAVKAGTVEGTTTGQIIFTQTGGWGNTVLEWTGGINNQWNFTTKNWLDLTGSAEKFFDGDHVIFNGAGTGDVEILSAGAIVAGMQITHGYYNFTGGHITSAAAGQTTLTVPSDGYTQSLDISNATVRFTNAGLTFANGVTFGSGSDIAFGQSGSATTYNIKGDVTFDAGSKLNIDLSEFQSDKINVTGGVTINGGTLTLSAGNTQWQNGNSYTYTLINTTNGVSGQFDNLIHDFSFLNADLNYGNPYQVILNLSRNDASFPSVGVTGNQKNTAQAVEGLPTNHPVYNAIVLMNEQQARAAFENLSGEIYGSTRTMLLNNRYFRDSVNQRLINTSMLPLSRSAWISAWGYDGRISGNSNATKINNSGGGFALGADQQIRQNLVAGVVAGYEYNHVSNGDNRDSKSDVNAFHLGSYLSSQWHGIDLRAGVAYGYFDIDTKREIWINSLSSTAKASYKGHQYQLFAELSKDFAIKDGLTISSYLNMAKVWLKFNDANEKIHLRL